MSQDNNPDGDPLDDLAEPFELGGDSSPEIPLDITALENLARRTKAGLPSKDETLQKVQEEVQKQMDALQIQFPLPPYDEILHREEYWETLSRCMDIVSKYTSNGEAQLENPGLVSGDLVTLAAALVYLGPVIGYIDGCVDHAEAQRKYKKSKASTLAKSSGRKMGITVTDRDAEDVAEVITEEDRKNHEAMNLMAKTLKGSYFSIKSFVEEVNKVIGRISRERVSGL